MDCRSRIVAAACLFASVIAVSGCSELPGSGPSSFAIARPDSGTALPYVLIQVSGDSVAPLSQSRSLTLQGSFSDRRPAPLIRLGTGDVVSVSIFEAAPGGLFTPAQTAGARPGNFVDLPTQAIDQNGNISVPYAGSVRAAGRTLPEVQALIQQRLQNRAIEPQAVVSLSEQHANTASVLGEVNQPGVFALNASGERILSILARAGGPKYQALETFVTVQRAGRSVRVRMTRLVADPRENIFVQPQDAIFLTHEAPVYVVVGAVGATSGDHVIPFDTEEVSLAQALGKAGGIADNQGDASSVFIYRLEDRNFLRDLGTDIAGFPSGPVPAIYQVDLRDPTGYLISTRFQMRDKDVVYVANAASVDFLKLLTVVNAITSTIQTGRTGIQAISSPLSSTSLSNPLTSLSTTTTSAGVPVVSTVPTSF